MLEIEEIFKTADMHPFAVGYVRVVDRINYYIGRVMMYGVFAIVGILLWSTISKALFVVPAFWTLEVAQFALAAYYIMGGPYSIQLGANVRMDLFYGNWSLRKRAWFDSFTILLLILYLGVLLYGGIESTSYSLEYGERNPSLWRPYIWPVKAMMCFGFFLMLLQAISELIKDIARLRGATA
ncbi:TRAP transporter small permease subunit [uncultured Cohaesibacter sp.]|uniref:TRAP transporter small permease subunit n=1 Tax=uncultured Cohaesibacter sp. TaxID=1002546 RepID=UPI0029C84B86|nr:TRAP transporter small permease subunit [uncultured Cohaesibacter sp.]